MLGLKHLPISLTEILTISAAELQLVGVAGILKIVVAPKPNNVIGWRRTEVVKRTISICLLFPWCNTIILYILYILSE